MMELSLSRATVITSKFSPLTRLLGISSSRSSTSPLTSRLKPPQPRHIPYSHHRTITTMAPTTCKAIIISSPGNASVTDAPVPKLRDDYILVRTTAVGLNPTDWKSIDGAAGKDCAGCKAGCDYAGVVEEVGSAVTKDFKKGDRICGFAHGVNINQPEDGAFGEYIVVKGDLQIKAPSNLKDEEVAGLGVGISTVGQGLYQALGLPLPTSPSSTATPILINGGSTATGMLGIQYAKLSGYRVLTTCSPRNADYLKSLGADETIDYTTYNTPEKFASQVHSLLGDDDALTLVWDCIATSESAKLIVPAISKKNGGKYRSLLIIPSDVVKGINDKVDNSSTLAYTSTGEAFTKFGNDFPAKPEDAKHAQMFWEMSRELLESGKLKVPRQDVNRGGKGLEGVLKGLDELRNDRVSGTKLVYTL